MDRLLDMDQLPKLSPDDTENLNRSITRLEIESVLNTLPMRIRLGPNSFTDEYYQSLKRTNSNSPQTIQRN